MNSRAAREYERRMQRAAEYRAARESGDPQGYLAQLRKEEAEAAQSRQVSDDEALAARARLKDNAARADFLVREAMARGDWDNLKYAGKPIPGLGEAHDPDWWVTSLIERENLTGLGPKAILLRTEDAGLDARLDHVYTEKQVRDIVEDFNKRVIDARRQLLGGPPVITKTRDVDGEVERWHQRRTSKTAQAARDEDAAAEEAERRSWWQRVWKGTG
ncbi:DnaJ family domain-containing protein [Arthrobacter sp. TMN-37]